MIEEDHYVIKIFEDTEHPSRALKPDDLFRPFPSQKECCRILIPDKTLSVNMIDYFTKNKDPFRKIAASQWSSQYDFHLVKFTCGLDIDENYYRIKELELRLSIDPTNNEVEKPCLFIVHPKNKYKKGNLSMDCDLSAVLGFDVGKIIGVSANGAKIEGKTVMNFKYNPVKCIVVAGGNNNSNIFWRIKAYNGVYPTGDITTLFYIQRPRCVKELTAIVDVKAKFKKSSAFGKVRDILGKSDFGEWDGKLKIDFIPSKI